MAGKRPAMYASTVNGRGRQVVVAEVMLRDPERVVAELAGEVRERQLARHPLLVAHRWAIEPAAAELAAERADPEGVARLRELATDLEASHDGPYQPLDARFHLAVADLACAPSLAAAVAEAQARVAEVIAHIQPMPAALRHSDAQHRALIDAIERGDRPAARGIMGEHISATANLLRGFLI